MNHIRCPRCSVRAEHAGTHRSVSAGPPTSVWSLFQRGATLHKDNILHNLCMTVINFWKTALAISKFSINACANTHISLEIRPREKLSISLWAFLHVLLCVGRAWGFIRGCPSLFSLRNRAIYYLPVDEKMKIWLNKKPVCGGSGWLWMWMQEQSFPADHQRKTDKSPRKGRRDMLLFSCCLWIYAGKITPFEARRSSLYY